VKYRDFMTPEETMEFMEYVNDLDAAYRRLDEFFEEFDEGDAEDWTEKERRAMLP
jgi:hypothetical protein